MTQRIELKEYLLIPRGAEIGIDLENQRIAKFLSDFKKLTPSSSRLRWSYLVASKRNREEGLFLVIAIKESSQLPLLSRNISPFNSNSSGFDEEVTRIKAEIDGLPSYVAWALGPAIRPTDLRGNDEDTQKLRTVRHLMLRARGRSVLYGLSTPDTSVSRAFFSDGVVAEVCATVVSISRHQCRLAHLRLCDSRSDGLADIRIPTKATMWHAGHERDPEAGLNLYYEMAKKETLARFLVNVVWDSVTGLIHHLELLSILPISELPP